MAGTVCPGTVCLQTRSSSRSSVVTILCIQAELQKLTAVNSELQRKLESQTQRLELAIQQQAHASPHAATASSPSAFGNTSASTALRPQLQQAPPQLQQAAPQLLQAAPQLQSGAQMWQPHQAAQWQPSGEGDLVNADVQHAQGKQQWQSPPYHTSQHSYSAPPTPQQLARKPVRAAPGAFLLSGSVTCL